MGGFCTRKESAPFHGALGIQASDIVAISWLIASIRQGRALYAHSLACRCGLASYTAARSSSIKMKIAVISARDRVNTGTSVEGSRRHPTQRCPPKGANQLR